VGQSAKVRLNPDALNGKMVVKFCGVEILTEWVIRGRVTRSGQRTQDKQDYRMNRINTV
jgi:hypothetical protein